MTRLLATITIDPQKCGDAFACRRCVDACPMRALAFRNKVPSQKFKETDAVEFQAIPHRPLFCVGCMDCVELCPQKAISVSF